ncbi:3-phosphoserine/phosphohydroxythreonine aminotransferase [Pedobacter ginsengisoli]|uniref:Phosphoserine aminotransferase n=1 Tax=Pedobacter ginsengisoli TaxID=363852 RepID=A0A2D1U761_9SPHI|nr:3-phosphoserine/phosphohydroxythreonine transaminase [Pedobacter ginsengisoli]ATP57445.1 3-phosphoserine/phosphohydroxythreonine aminotransferase [Pedobacter ginsengisoli]
MNENKKHNFGAGPCILPESVLCQAANAVIDWNDMGLSILEVSHRSPEFESVVLKTQLLVRELLHIPDSYAVLFLQGGASTQFSMIPMNFLKGKSVAAYLDTGYFAQKAIQEAKHFGTPVIVGSSRDKQYNYIPDYYDVPSEAAYLHITSNNTIEGTEQFEFPTQGIPMICDMSSDIFSRMVDVRKFDLIYAGAQKNMGPAGMTMVIIKNELIDTITHEIPAMSDYRVLEANNSLYNTPPVFAIYTAMLNLIWLKDQGGILGIEQKNIKKAMLLYKEIDENPLFYGLAQPAHRSRMNVTFKMYDESLEKVFLTFATERNIVGIQGYRTVGGFRASLYNALPIESVQVLVTVMRDFAAELGLHAPLNDLQGAVGLARQATS